MAWRRRAALINLLRTRINKNMIIVFATLLSLCVAVKQASRQEMLKNWLSSEKACESFESSMFNPMRCKNP